jgi:outer membrane protein OmpA-like peptidoglycan-associated protein
MTTPRYKKAALLAAAAFAMTLSGPSLAADDETIKGIIVSHDRDAIVIRSGTVERTIVLNADTEIRSTAGSLGVRTEKRPATDLMRGLPVQVKVTQVGDRWSASEVKFSNDDFKTAQQISAGLVQTEERIDNVGELVAAGRTKVFFDVGSSKISPRGQEDLRAIAAQAKGMTGYRLAIVGRADTSGNAAANQRLSEARAAAVKDYLLKSAAISPANILPLAAAGSAEVFQDPDPPRTAAEARRVTVTIAVSKSSVGR